MGCNVSSDTFVVEELHESESSGRAAARENSPVHVAEAEDGAAWQAGACWLWPPGPASARADFSVRVHRQLGDVLGAGFGNTSKGAVILSIKKNGLLDGWNKANPCQALHSGLIITEVNGVTDFWSILEELHKPGELAMMISATPPENASSNWFEEIAEIGRELEAQDGRSSFMLRLEPQDPGEKIQKFSGLPNVRAGETGVEQCAICMEDVSEDDTMVQLPCKHAFHALCAARWLTQARVRAHGQRQCCPLCCRKVVSTAEGGIGMVEEAQK